MNEITRKYMEMSLISNAAKLFGADEIEVEDLDEYKSNDINEVGIKKFQRPRAGSKALFEPELDTRSIEEIMRDEIEGIIKFKNEITKHVVVDKSGKSHDKPLWIKDFEKNHYQKLLSNFLEKCRSIAFANGVDGDLYLEELFKIFSNKLTVTNLS